MKKTGRWLSFVLCGAMCMMALGACGGSKGGQDASQADVVETIKTRGKLVCGVKYDVPNFGYEDPVTGKLEGFEIDLCRKLAGKILGDEDAVEFVMCTAKTRGALMDSGEIDVCIATMTTNDERLASYAHTEPYYTDIGAVMVMADSGIESFADLDGKVMGAPQGSTSMRDAMDKAAEMGIAMTESSEYATIADCKAALTAGRVDAITNDNCMLTGLLDKNTVILPEKYHKQYYRIWSKLGNDTLMGTAQEMLDELSESGEMQELLTKWGLEDYAEYEQE